MVEVTNAQREPRRALKDERRAKQRLENVNRAKEMHAAPSFRYMPAALRRIVRQLEPGRKNVVEFLHKSWWNDRVYDAFREAGIIFCSCSGPRLPDALVKTANDVYVRFHGIKDWYRHNYSRLELEVWANRLRDCGASTIWAYFNNDRNGYVIKNARLLERLMK